MISLIKLKKEVQFNGEFTKVVDVMKGIAAARYYVLERELSLFEPFTKAAETILSMVDLTQLVHPFVQARTPVTGVILVTSDAGFLGGLNSQVVNIGVHEGGSQGALTVIGERGTGYVRDAKWSCTAFPGIQDNSRGALAIGVRDHIVQQVLGGVCGRLVVVYPKPVSFSTQEVTVETLLPCTAWVQASASGAAPSEVVWESRPEDVVEYVLTQWIAHRLEEIFALSRLAELSARAVHLEGSFQELLRLGKKLKFQYHRARHEIIDRSMREIFAAQLLYRRSHE